MVNNLRTMRVPLLCGGVPNDPNGTVAGLRTVLVYCGIRTIPGALNSAVPHYTGPKPPPV